MIFVSNRFFLEVDAALEVFGVGIAWGMTEEGNFFVIIQFLWIHFMMEIG